MTVKDFHTLVEQDVQKISSFAYEDMLPEEVDIQANKSYYEFLNDFAKFQPRGNRINDTEARLNDIRTLIVRDTPLSTIRTGGVSVASLPGTYLYLVGLKVDTFEECSAEYVTRLEVGKLYMLKSDTLSLEGITYLKGDIVKIITPFTTGDNKLVELTKRQVPVRVVSNEEADELNAHHYGKSGARSPIAVISEDKITIYCDDFFVDKLYLSFIKKPVAINIATPNTEIELPKNSAYKLARLTVDNILRVTEQGQQKIENLKSEIK